MMAKTKFTKGRVSVLADALTKTRFHERIKAIWMVVLNLREESVRELITLILEYYKDKMDSLLKEVEYHKDKLKVVQEKIAVMMSTEITTDKELLKNIGDYYRLSQVFSNYGGEVHRQAHKVIGKWEEVFIWQKSINRLLPFTENEPINRRQLCSEISGESISHLLIRVMNKEIEQYQNKESE